MAQIIYSIRPRWRFIPTPPLPLYLQGSKKCTDWLLRSHNKKKPKGKTRGRTTGRTLALTSCQSFLVQAAPGLTGSPWCEHCLICYEEAIQHEGSPYPSAAGCKKRSSEIGGRKKSQMKYIKPHRKQESKKRKKRYQTRSDEVCTSGGRWCGNMDILNQPAPRPHACSTIIIIIFVK